MDPRYGIFTCRRSQDREGHCLFLEALIFWIFWIFCFAFVFCFCSFVLRFFVWHYMHMFRCIIEVNQSVFIVTICINEIDFCRI